MAISDAQKVDLLYKKAFGVAKTDLPINKGPSNESIPSPLFLRGDTIWTQASSIPSTAAAVPSLIQAYVGNSGAVQCTADNTTVPVGGIYPTWLTHLTNWIPPEFGSTYFPQIWVDTTGSTTPTTTGTQLFSAGVVNFIGGTIPVAVTAGKSLFVVGYRYIGLLGVTNLPASTTTNLTVTGTTNLGPISNVTITGGTTGQVLVTDGAGNLTWASGLPSQTGNNGKYLTTNGSIPSWTTITSVGTLTGLTVSGTTNLGPQSNVTITGGSSGYVLTTDGAGHLTWSAGVPAVGGAYVYTQALPATIWNVPHNLGVQYVNVEVVDSTDFSYTGRYDYPTIQFVDINNLTLTFGTAVAGFAAVTSGGGAVGPAGTYTAGTGISLLGNAITNTGVTALTTSSGLSTNTSATGAVSVTNTGVTSIVAGTNVSVSGATGAVTINVSGTISTATTATNIAAGAANSLPYQTGSGATAFLAQGTGVLQEIAGAPTWTTVPTLTGTNFSAIPNGALSNSSITINGSSVSLGGSVNITGLPSQTGNNGKYLTTDGTNASWGTLSSSLTIGTTNIALGTTALSLAGLTSVSATTLTGTLSTAAQTNITSLGNLTSLTVSGATNLGSLANVTITGGSSGFVLGTNGSGALSWVAPPGGVAGSFVYTQSPAATVWNITHNLGVQYVNVEVIDSTGFSYTGRYDYPTIQFINSNSLTLTFGTAVTGFAAITSGGGVTGPAGTYSAGSGISLLSNTIANTGVTSATGSTNIAITGTGGPAYTGGVTISLTGVVPSSTNIAGGATYSIPYQTGAGATGFLAGGTGVLQETAGAPIWTTAPSIAGTNFTGTASSLTAGLATTASYATNMGGGSAGTIVYQSAPSTTAFLAQGTSSQVLISGTTPSWANISGLNVNTAGSATNIAGGGSGSIPYNTAGGTTSQLTAGTSSQVLISGTTPSWANISGLSVATSANIGLGAANQIPYQTGAGITSFYSAANYGVHTYGATGVPASVAGAAGVLQGSASAIPTFTTTPTLTGTNFSGIGNGALTNSSITFTQGTGITIAGSPIAVALGGAVTITNAGVTSFTATGLSPARTGAVTLVSADIVAALGYTPGSATGLTSLGMSVPAFLSVSTSPSPNPITASGTFAVTLSGTALPLANGGTGQTTAQLAINSLAGAVTTAQYLRGNGTNVVMNSIQAADVPTLNQNTSGTAAGLSTTLVVGSGGTGVTSLTTYGVLYGGSTVGATAAGITGQILIGNTSAAPSWSSKVQVTTAGSVAAGTGSLATTATDGFFYIPTCAGVPTGVPTAISGFAPMVIDSTDNSMYIYVGGAWRQVFPAVYS